LSIPDTSLSDWCSTDIMLKLSEGWSTLMKIQLYHGINHFKAFIFNGRWSTLTTYIL
jgi:hypothetical protein